jgi:hypothetical protein
MTRRLTEEYFKNRTFYNIQAGSLIDNPDQRISSDVRHAPPPWGPPTLSCQPSMLVFTSTKACASGDFAVTPCHHDAASARLLEEARLGARAWLFVIACGLFPRARHPIDTVGGGARHAADNVNAGSSRTRRWASA